MDNATGEGVAPAAARLGFTRAIAWTLARHLAAFVVGLGLVVVVARTLGPAGNGVYNLTILLPQALANLLNMGVGSAIVYYVGRGDSRVRGTLATLLRLGAALAGAGLVVGGALVAFWPGLLFGGVASNYLWLALANFPLLLFQLYLLHVLQARQDFAGYNRAMLAAPVASLVLAAILLGALGWPVVGALVAFTAGNAIGLAAAWIAVRRHVEPPAPADGDVQAAPLVQYGMKVHLGNLVGFLNQRASLLLVNAFLNPAGAGIYIVAVQLSERLAILSQATSTVLFPRLAELHRDEEARRRLTAVVGRWMLLVTALGALALGLAAPALLPFLMGAEYAEAAQPLRWLLPGVALVSLSRILANDVSARGRPEVTLYAGVAGLSVNLAASLVLIPQAGLTGAAMAGALSMAASTLAMLVGYARMSGTRWTHAVVPRRDDLRRLRQLVFRARPSPRPAARPPEAPAPMPGRRARRGGLLLHLVLLFVVAFAVLQQRILLDVATGGSGILPLLVLLAPLAGVVVVVRSRGRAARLLQHPLAPLWVPFLALAILLPVLGVIVHGAPARVAFAAMTGVAAAAVACLGYWAACRIEDRGLRHRLLYRYLHLGILVQFAYALAQQLHDAGLAHPTLAAWRAWDARVAEAFGQEILSRSTGFYVNPNVLGLWAVLSFFAAWFAPRSRLRLPALAAALATLLLSQSRGALAAFAVASTWMLVAAAATRRRGEARFRPAHAAALLVTFLVAAAVAAQVDDRLATRLGSGLAVAAEGIEADANLAGRVEYWRFAFDFYRTHATGTLVPPEHLTSSVMDNDWVRLLLQGGPLFVLALALPLAAGALLSDPRVAEGRMLRAWSIAIPVVALTQPSFVYPPIALYWFGLGVYFARTRRGAVHAHAVPDGVPA